DNIDVMAELPQLEHLLVGHNSIAAYEASFHRIKVLSMDHNPVTRFGLTTPVPTLSVLNLASAKLTQLPDDLFARISNISKLVLDKNHFTALSPLIGKLTRLEHLSVAKNMLNSLPSDIGRLQDLKYLDIRENNLSRLPQEIWYARRLESLNIASNVLNEFPKPGAPPPSLPSEAPTPVATTGGPQTPDFDELGKLEAWITSWA
ncbi:adenylate cyclase protein, partial [Aureobasidium melanogenum]